MSAATVAAALGGREVLKDRIESELDLDAAVRRGISAEAAAKVLASGMLTADELYSLVLPRRTFERRREDGQSLTIVEGDRLLRAVRVVLRAIEALGDAEKASVWLRTPNRALNGEKPMSLLETDIGARLVERTLGRIEHGVYS
jgi:putative toxin-antitoxin system antitoxin component (TIGR02293 family)